MQSFAICGKLTNKYAIQFYVFSFVGEIKAVKSVWFMGDEFLLDIFHALQELRIQDHNSTGKIPYIYEFYNVVCLLTKDTIPMRNSFGRMLNGLVKGLSNTDQLPRFLLVIPDGDLLRTINFFQYGINMIIGKCLNWLINSIDRALETKKEELRRRHHGSVVAAEPKVIWVKMINKINGQSQILQARRKFNAILEELLVSKKQHYIANVNDVVSYHSMFIANNYINNNGKKCFLEGAGFPN